MITTFKYGLLAPITNLDLVRDQIKRGHNYQNALIEIERWRRNEIRTLESQIGNIPMLTTLLKEADDKVLAIIKAIKVGNAKARSRVETPEMKEELVAAKKARKGASAALIQARRELRENVELSSKKEAIHTEENRRKAIVRKDKETAPWSGTYMLIEAAVQKTREMDMYNGIEPNDPSFRPFKGEGRVGKKQFQPLEPLSKVIGIGASSLYVQIVPMPPPAPRTDGKPRKIGKKDLRMFRLRIGTSDKGKPVWAEFPMVYHRDIPAGSVVSVVQVSCNKIGPREHWTVSITVNDNKEALVRSDNSCVAFDLGWREFQGEKIRVAKWHGSDGEKGEVFLPQSLLDKLRKVEQISSGRDKDFDAIRNTLVDWLVKSEASHPQWLKDKTTHIDQWKSQARLVKLVRQWANNRFNGDDEILHQLEGWRYHDHHLWCWESSQRIKAIGHRNEIYRIVAAQLAEKYGTIVFEDINLSNLAKGKVAGGNRQLTAPSELRNACKNASRTRGKDYAEVSARKTSKICASCGYENEIGSALEYFCEGCDIELDRDENAAENVLNRYLSERASAEQKAGGARKEEIVKEVA